MTNFVQCSFWLRSSSNFSKMKFIINIKKIWKSSKANHGANIKKRKPEKVEKSIKTQKHQINILKKNLKKCKDMEQIFKKKCKKNEK